MKDVAVVEKAENVSVDATATTGSSDAFLHLSDNGGLWDKLGGVSKGGLNSGAGEDVVFGDVDGGGGDRPENPAFSDRKVDGSNGNNYPHKVTGFSGICQEGEAFPASTCNGKVIAARYYVAGMGAANIPDYEYLSPRDCGGHGSHTASTAAGNRGVQATVDGRGLRHDRGSPPRAHRRLQGLLGGPERGQRLRATADITAAIEGRRRRRRRHQLLDQRHHDRVLDPVELSFLYAAAAGRLRGRLGRQRQHADRQAQRVAQPSPWIMTTAAGTHNREGQGTRRTTASQQRHLFGARLSPLR